MTTDIETVIIGAGVIGLSIGAELARRGQNILLIERADRAGTETSARNSGVIHAGIYYPKGSLRAKFCVDGKHALYRFCEQNGVPFHNLGKLIVATKTDDIPKLESIAKNAKACGVLDLVPLDKSAAINREPQLQCEAALLSPSTGIIDVHAFITALEGHISTFDGSVIFNTNVDRIKQRNDATFEIETRTHTKTNQINPTTRLTAKNIVIAAGLHATDIADKVVTSSASKRKLQSYTSPRTYFAKGHYFALTGKSPFETLIYPLPAKTGLGIHLTLEMDGRAKFGPDLTWTDTIDYHFDDEDGSRQKNFEDSIRSFWPSLPANAIHPDSTGIRPRPYHAGEPMADFVIHDATIHGTPNLVALYGIESPGLTSALAIAVHVADLINANPQHSVRRTVTTP